MSEPSIPLSLIARPGERRQGIKTLVVDDDPTSRALLAKILIRAGHEAYLAASAEDALIQFQAFDPDIVMMDVVLPGIGGLQALRMMKQARGDRWLPIILVSIKDTSEEVLEGLDAGADYYLTKPIAVEQTLAKLKNVSTSLSLQREVRGLLGFTRVVVDHIAEALLCVDDHGRVLVSNRAALLMFGSGPEMSLVGADANQFFVETPDWSAQKAEVVARVFGTGRRRNQNLFSFEAQHTGVFVAGAWVSVITVRDITNQLEEERRRLNENARLREYKAAREAENELAREMLEKLLHRKGRPVRNVHYSIEAANGFSGDAVAALWSPTGHLFVMLADATGHGLAAAISLVPALSILHAMVDRQRALPEIVAELNTKLRDVIPTGRFLAAAIVCLDLEARTGEIWVGGVPGVLLVDAHGVVTQRFDSSQLPLGIEPTTPARTETVRFAWGEGPQQLILISDGMVEATNPHGAYFGERGLVAALAAASHEGRLEAVTAALRAHLADQRCEDDASIALVDLG